MSEDVWLPSGLTDDMDLDLVTLASSSLEYDIDKVRAFVVALLNGCKRPSGRSKG